MPAGIMSSRTAFAVNQGQRPVTARLTGLPPAQRIARAVIEGADTEAVETLLIDLERAANEQLGREFLDGIFDRLGGTLEARIAHRPLTGLARAGIKLGGSPVIERTHENH